MQYDLVNLTPHAISVQDNYGETRVLAAAAAVPARVETRYERVAVRLTGLCDCTYVAVRGAITGLPDATAADHVYRMPSDPHQVAPGYIVSLMVAEAAWQAGREDVFAPGELIRDDAGRPIAARGVVCNPAILERSIAEARTARAAYRHNPGSWQEQQNRGWDGRD